MTRLRLLLLAPECNPDSISTPQIGYAHAEALARLHAVTLVVRAVHEVPVRRANGPFHAIETIPLAALDPLYAWALRHVFKYDYGRQSLTAASYPLQVAFELRAWQRLRARILAREFDVVLRIMPIVSVLPSPFAFFLRNGPIPFVIGPLNGGLPWPEGFPQLDKQRRAAGYSVAKLRGLYKYLPFARATYTKSSAIIAGSSHTFAEFAAHRDKLFFVPGENGIDPALLNALSRTDSRPGDPLRLAFVGRLIPLKACDLALRGAAQLLRSGQAHFTVVGDGPERAALHELAIALGIQQAVTFTGWLSVGDTLAQLQRADVLVFPSLREFGGAVTFEALAMGAVPVVADFGGPGDIVTPDIGYKIPLTNEHQLVDALESVLMRLANDRPHLESLRRQGMAHARANLTWDGKARVVTEVLHWVTGHAPKPALFPPHSRDFASSTVPAQHDTSIDPHPRLQRGAVDR
jgi:glycosyltransferase involved in cell wall biosynthesis